MEKHYETKIYTSNGVEFTAPMSKLEIEKKIKENDGVIVLTRYEVRSRKQFIGSEGQFLEVKSKTKVDVYLDTKLTPIVIFEEAEMEDEVMKPKENLKSKK